MNMIGTSDFIVKRSSVVNGENQYTISTQDEYSQEYLYVSEKQLDELINLLQKAKEIL